MSCCFNKAVCPVLAHAAAVAAYILPQTPCMNIAPLRAPLHALQTSHHGGDKNEDIIKSMNAVDRIELELAQIMPEKYKARRSAIVVCHSYPLNWAVPEPPKWYVGDHCPPDRKAHPWVYTVGRTMFETDLLPRDFLPK
jgi:hypothetical protein